jgi:hypothetical protein
MPIRRPPLPTVPLQAERTQRAPVVEYSQTNLLRIGLELAGFPPSDRGYNATNLERFHAWYGSNPVVCSKLYSALQLTAIDEALIDPQQVDIRVLLLGLYFLKAYPTESICAGFFKKSEKTVRHLIWTIIRKIQALKNEKVGGNQCDA